MRHPALMLATTVACLGLLGCGDFLPLDEDPATNVRISRFDPSPVAPIYDPQAGILLPTSNIYVENYSQVPVNFDHFKVEYFEATVPTPGLLANLNTQGMFTLYLPGVPTPDPYVPDSMATRQIKVTSVGGLQILTAKAYEEITRGTVDYADDLDMYAVVTLSGLTDSGIEAEIQGAVAISSLLQQN
ncbi:MAG: hypothetical protein MUE60_04905 [Candidatus Eisenbacteria bacterium]|jgi:hypothetical protein|nr:hypothetical protein [Candidatus Eisenbacteria bacterium]